MRRWLRVTLLVVVVFLAGCGGTAPDTAPENTSPETTETAETTETTDTTTETTDTSDDDADATASGSVGVETAATPYGDRPLTVYLDDSAATRNVGPSVQAALTYWETDGEPHLPYEVGYVRTQSRSNADIVIEFRDEIDCGIETVSDTVGCAPIVRPETTAPDPALVQVQTNLSDPTITSTTVHELGHAHGLEHGDEPADVMDEHVTALTTGDEMAVYLRSTDGEVPGYVREEIGDGLDYFVDHPDLRYAETFAWSYVDEPADATVIITYDEADAGVCFEDGAGSCVVAGEYDAQPDVRLEGINTHAAPWHVGAMLWPQLVTEQPEGLESDTDRHEREQWP